METVEQLVSFAHIQVQLCGGAPWGFTLKGGLEHGEPLIITKIEDGGKAAVCKKLKVGDELININGTVLYGSRQEALILIKGSYRLLKLTVRRRTVPLIRPHSWHLAKISEPALPPPPPPPSPPCLPPADSPPLPPPPPSTAMQLHPGSYSLPWHNNDNSDLSMQWGHLSRPYSSTDRSSSLGSMESLDTATPTAQTYSDSHNSPVDPTLFNNKRDSAYSSFSASSNTSDYATVPLRFGEAGSMDNLLQNLGPTCQGFPSGDASTQALDDGQITTLKSRSLTRPRPKPVQVKERPSSCCYKDDRSPDDFGSLRNGEQESQRKSNPPQPPTRKDSFRATKSCPNVPNKRCASAPIEMSNVPSYYEDNTTSIKNELVHNGFSASEEDNTTKSYKDNTLDYIQNQASSTSSNHYSSKAESICRPHTKHSSSTVLHRHSAPEKLLATQLQLLRFDSSIAPIEPHIPPKLTNLSSSRSSQWSKSQPERDQESSSNRWSGSRCSTPGSVFLEDGGEDEDCNERLGVNGGCGSPTQSQISRGRSVSVPEEPLGTLTQSKHNSEILERDFKPISSAGSVDILVEKRAVKIEESIDGDVAVKKSSRNLRKNRRRNERFATNLRNEIQRKKAQLHSSRGPGGLLCSGETVHEEGPEFHEEGESDWPETKANVSFVATTTAQDVRTVTPVENSNSEVLPNQSNTSRSVQIVDPGVPNFGVGIRVVEEPAPAGKARRWRWTPEHKLQLEDEPQKNDCEKVLDVTKSRHGVCAFTSSTASYSRSSSCSRMNESDVLPFADRMKFFEETSKGIAGSKAPSITRQKTYHPENQGGDLGPYQSQRRYSYQGGFKQESSCTMEARRLSVSTKERERERDEKLRQLEIERQMRELELERTRLREKEKEERLQQWEQDCELERQQEIERICEMDRLKREKEELERQKQRKEDFKLRHEFYGSNNSDLYQDFHQHKDPFHSFQPHGFSQSHSQGSRSAFYPVNSSSQHFENQQHQGYTARSHTPTEMYPARQQETTKLNRKYSLTERDYLSRRWESRPSEQPQFHQNRWGPRQTDSSASNGYTFTPAPAPLSLRTRAMSESDLRFDSNHRWGPYISTASSQTLSEVEEGVSNNTKNPPIKKKMPPPPRPPPPKWEQFHRRRASHHALYSSSVLQTVTGDFSNQSSFISEPEMSRQRSYSLPPQRQDVTSGCPKCSCHQSQPQEQPLPQASSNQHHEIQRYPHFPSNQSQPQLQEPLFNIAPPSPMFSRRTFRPVAPPHRDVSVRDSFSGEHDEFPPPPPPVADDISNSLFDTETSQISDQDRVQIIKTQMPNTRHTAEWERTPSSRIHSNTAPPPVVQNGNPEHFNDSNINNMDQQKPQETRTEPETTLSPSPARSLEADLDVPMETDIDDFQEVELPIVNEPISSELPCFALPVTVLETDLDTLPAADQSSPSGRTRLESSSLDEELEVREGLSLDDIFPQSSEGESGTESWRGPFQSTEHNTDSLDRRSGASSSCSSYYSTSTAKAQLLTQMKDFTENRDEDDELTYKKQLMESLRKKLGVLREAQRGLQEDIRANAQLGGEVEAMVEAVCKPNEVDKFRMFIGDMDKVVSLMLSLSGRLLRVETTLDTLDAESDNDERLPLLEKKRQLMRQLSEAQDLKEHVDRREQAVSRVLGRCLMPEQHRDYSHFVKMKAALLVEQRQLEDKIRLGEEQLRGLRESLGLGLGLGLGLSMGYGQY